MEVKDGLSVSIEIEGLDSGVVPKERVLWIKASVRCAGGQDPSTVSRLIAWWVAEEECGLAAWFNEFAGKLKSDDEGGFFHRTVMQFLASGPVTIKLMLIDGVVQGAPHEFRQEFVVS